jgi:hypothetical protein
MYRQIFDYLRTFHFISSYVPGTFFTYRKVCMYWAVVCASLGLCIMQKQEMGRPKDEHDILQVEQKRLKDEQDRCMMSRIGYMTSSKLYS